MKKRIILLMFVAVTIQFCSKQNLMYDNNLTDFVDPFIGTSGHGHTFPGATLPFGMVQLSPDTGEEGWDWCSGYHSSDNSIIGFSHKHLSGTGASDYGDILFMPTIGDVHLNRGTKDNPDSGYRSRFSHENEIANPGYYSVLLDDSKIKAELTTTLRAGFHKYTFPSSNKSNIVFDLEHGIHDKPIESFVKINGKDEIVGYRKSSGWANFQQIYFVAKFSKSFNTYQLKLNDELLKNREEVKGTDVRGYLTFTTEENEIILVKVGISAVSIEGARKNLFSELPGWDFDKIRNNARDIWNKSLQKIQVEGSDRQKTIYYTSLYHSLIAPNIFMDVDNQYRGMDGKVHLAEGFTNYTVFSLWDTFRAAHPLFTIIEPDRVDDMLNTFIKKYEQSGLLPIWELDANETNCMIGYHSIPVIADAYTKGMKNYDISKLYDAMITSAMQDEFGIKFYREYGYIPSDKEHESVSKTLEYTYDDWCIAQVAKKLGKNDDYEEYMKRAQFYKNIFDKSTGFMRPKKNGKWEEPFEPKSVSGDYTEANAWQYSFFVPHDVENMIKLFGGDNKFCKKLDQLFTESENLEGRHQSDITGLIGQYAHGNEPSHHMAYLYNYAGQPWKTQEKVKEIIDVMYTDQRDGICGNEDCGQMSAWYVFSALGFYPVCPGTDYYVIGTPTLPLAQINIGKRKSFKIIAENVSTENIYIQSIKLNGKKYSKSWITHSDIMNGGKIEFIMGDTPNKNWAVKKSDRPKSVIEKEMTSVPFFEYKNASFYDPIKVEIKSGEENSTIYYTIDGSNPTISSVKYKKPMIISESQQIKAIAIKDGMIDSYVATADFRKIPYRKNIKIISKYAGSYSAGGDFGLIDFVFGSKNYWTGSWQGYEGQDFEAIVDLLEVKEIKEVSTKFLQSLGAWIFLPEEVEYLISTDGQKYKSLAKLKHNISKHKNGTVIQEFNKSINPSKCRYVKVKAKSIKTCPDWHQGSGGKAWLFIDEIVIE